MRDVPLQEFVPRGAALDRLASRLEVVLVRALAGFEPGDPFGWGDRLRGRVALAHVAVVAWAGFGDEAAASGAVHGVGGGGHADEIGERAARWVLLVIGAAVVRVAVAAFAVVLLWEASTGRCTKGGEGVGLVGGEARV